MSGKKKGNGTLGKRWDNWLYKTFDFRFIYIMRDSDGVEKLGISRNSKLRRKQIDDSMEVSIKLLFEIKLFFAGFHEKRLHLQYENKWNPKKRGVSGRLEFFRLTWFDVLSVKMKLRGIYLRQRISILLSVFFLCYFAFLLASKL